MNLELVKVLKKSFKDNMNVIGYYVKNMIRYWKITIKLMVSHSRPEWSEITVDELHDAINSNQSPLILDIRSTPEFADVHILNAWSIPFTELDHSKDLQPFKEKEIVTICPGGGLSLMAVDVLVNIGFKNVKSLQGGMNLWVEKGYPTTTVEEISFSHNNSKSGSFEGKPKLIEEKQSLDEKPLSEVHYTVDARNLLCPKPVLKSMKALKALGLGQVLEILTTDPGSLSDIPAWARATGQELLISEERGTKDFRFLVKRIK